MKSDSFYMNDFFLICKNYEKFVNSRALSNSIAISGLANCKPIFSLISITISTIESVLHDAHICNIFNIKLIYYRNIV